VSHIEQQTRSAWDAYGQHHLKRGTPLPDVDRITWGPRPGRAGRRGPRWPGGPAGPRPGLRYGAARRAS